MIRGQILAALRAVAVLTVLCGLAYPLAVTGAAQVAFSDKADGSLIRRDGKVVGSALLGQAFTGPKYFHPRPSAAGAAASGSFVDVVDKEGNATGVHGPADATDLSLVASGASNLGPTNEEFLAAVAERVAAYRTENGLDDGASVPVDAVTASGSGLDPHISVANARLQAVRVAKARNLPRGDVLTLLDEHRDSRALGVLGEEGVHVLRLNLALDERTAG